MQPTKKQKIEQKIAKIKSFGMHDVYLQPLVKSTKCNLIPMLLDADKKSPVLIQLSGGGKIPLAFGLEIKTENEVQKTTVSLQIECVEDHEHLDRLRTETVRRVIDSWPTWYPDNKPPSDEVLHTLCNTFVSARKKKKNSEDTWPGVTKASIDLEECLNGKCRIVHHLTGETIPYTTIAGMNWNAAILELRYIYIQATKSYGITKKLRYLSCTPMDAVTLDDVPKIHLFDMMDVQFEPLVKSTKCNLIPMRSLVGGGPVLVQLDGGGRIPNSFGIEVKEAVVDGRHKITACVQIDSMVDHTHLERLQRDLSTRAIELWPTWFPDTKPPSDEVVHTLCNGLVSVRKKKKNSDETWSGCMKVVIEPNDLSSGACAIIDQVCGDAVPYESLPGRTWTHITMELRYVYIMATKSYGITKKLRRLVCTPGDEYADIAPI